MKQINRMIRMRVININMSHWKPLNNTKHMKPTNVMWLEHVKAIINDPFGNNYY